MWHEARKQEKMIRGMMVDYRRRAERRKDFYEKMKSEPAQFLQLHGRRCKIHLDPVVAAAGDAPAIMMPWQGDTNNMIDRFDVRAHLDQIDETRAPDVPPHQLSVEERQFNYERYRILAQNTFLGISEDKFLAQLAIEEQFGVTLEEKEAQKEKLQGKKGTGAAIGYNYNNPEANPVPSASTAGPDKSKSQEESEDDSDLEIIDVDLSIDVNKVEPAQAHELNQVGPLYGLAGCDLFSYLTGDADDADLQRQRARDEREKAMYSGRKSRRERRAHRDKKLASRVLSPPSYAAPAPAAPAPPSRSPSPSPPPPSRAAVTFITSFGGDDDAPPPPLAVKSGKSLYSDKVKQNLSQMDTSYSAAVRGKTLRSPAATPSPQPRRLSPSLRRPLRSHSRSPYRPERPYRSRSKSPYRSVYTARSNSRSYKSRSKSPYWPSGAKSPFRARSKSRSPYGVRSKSRSPYRARSSSKSPYRARSTSRSPYKPRSTSRSPYRARSPYRSRSPSPQRRYRSRSLSGSPRRRSRSLSRGRRPSRTPNRTNEYTRNYSRSMSADSVRGTTEVGGGGGGAAAPPLPRYYGRRKAEQDSSSEVSLDTDSSDTDSKGAVGVKPVSGQNQLRLTGCSAKGGGSGGGGGGAISLKERLKRKMQAQLSRQLRADKKAAAERRARESEQQARRDEEIRELAGKLRRRHRDHDDRSSPESRADRGRSGSDSSADDAHGAPAWHTQDDGDGDQRAQRDPRGDPRHQYRREQPFRPAHPRGGYDNQWEPGRYRWGHRPYGRGYRRPYGGREYDEGASGSQRGREREGNNYDDSRDRSYHDDRASQPNKIRKLVDY